MQCKNCNQELIDQSSYCNYCGGKVIRNKLTLKNLFEHISETFFNYDNKLLRTFINLFKKPDDVIVGYISGTRKKYVNVISYFALAITISGLQIYIINRFGADLEALTTSSNAIVAEKQQEFNSKIFNFISEYQSIVMMLYIPLYALIAKLVFIRINKFNYTELLVVFMYSQAQISIVGVILTAIIIPFNLIPFTYFSLALLPIQLAYFTYVLKKVNSLDNFTMTIRTFFFLIILAILFVLFSIIMGVIMYKTGVYEEIEEAKKAALEASKKG